MSVTHESVMAGAETTMRMVEALLFAAAEPLSLRDLAERLPHGVDVGGALSALTDGYRGRGVELIRVGDRWRFQTASDLSFLMSLEREEPRRLSKAAQETLAIIAYHQPVTRAEIESIRGVQASAGTLDVLLEAGLIRMRGRRRTPGRPVTWGTTDAFLEHYGLESLSDLPGMAEMKAAGLLSLDLPAGFSVPDPSVASDDEKPLLPEEAPEFHQGGTKRPEPADRPAGVARIGALYQRRQARRTARNSVTLSRGEPDRRSDHG
jgi:segregation and condensation protein B